MPHEYSVEEILRAKRIAREAGYNVTLPSNKLDIAKNIAREAGYVVKEPSKVATTDPTPAPAALNPNPAPAPATDPVQDPAPAPVRRWRTAEEIAASYL